MPPKTITKTKTKTRTRTRTRKRMSGGATAVPESDTSNPINDAKPAAKPAKPATANGPVTDAAPGTGTSPGTGTGTVGTAVGPVTAGTTDAAVGTAVGPVTAKPVTDASTPGPVTTTGPVIAESATDAAPGTGTAGTTDGPANEPVTAHGPVEPNCTMEASILSSVPKECIKLTPTPALTSLIRAAISDQLANVTSDTVEGALEATGNAALLQLTTTSAFTPEQLKIMEKMSASDNVEMKEAVEKIQTKLSDAIAEGIETARKTVAPPLQQASGEIANGVIVSFLNAISDIPGVGVFLSALGLIDTAVKAASSATDIVEKAQEAAKPVTDAIADIQETVGELGELASAATNESAEKESAATGGESAATNESAATGGESAATNESAATGGESAATNQSAATENQSVNLDPNQSTKKEEQGGGGSRKRRRIHKLSRRIARTLRRVQKKYGLGLKDKGDFLRRTLNAKKLK
jgi:hypothetical protein